MGSLDICIVGVVSCAFRFAGGWLRAPKCRIKRCILCVIGAILLNPGEMRAGRQTRIGVRIHASFLQRHLNWTALTAVLRAYDRQV
jgi:hypothetical protein